VTIFVADVSAYQPNFDFGLAVQQGVEGFVIKSTEGSSWRNVYLADMIRRAQATGKPVMYYHFVISGDPAGQVANVLRNVPPGVPVALDVENGSDMATARAIEDGLNAAGHPDPVLYVPPWWLRSHGGADQPTADIAPLWSSWYPDNNGGTPAQAYARAGGDSGPGWAAYGQNQVKLWQFTSTAELGGYADVDVSAFKGGPQDLHNLFLGDDLSWTDTFTIDDGSEHPESATAIQWLMYANRKAGEAKADVEALTAKVDALTQTVGALALANGLTPDQLTAAVKAALAGLTLKVA
jgi:GH25 family lysozyme M1 (1,4-beta-N-acetylmuramidase)